MCDVALQHLLPTTQTKGALAGVRCSAFRNEGRGCPIWEACAGVSENSWRVYLKHPPPLPPPKISIQWVSEQGKKIGGCSPTPEVIYYRVWPG